MIRDRKLLAPDGFTLVEVVLALGIVGFSVLTTVGLLSVASDTNRRSRDETFAAQLAANEFEHIRALTQPNFPTPATGYPTHYFNSDLIEVPSGDPAAFYKFDVHVQALANGTPADLVFNADVLYPALAATPNKISFTTLMNIPKP